jgi:2-polyprenyl-3-methyl-5-hydroxy-6-metoxy-1,4-benzoquinol methylase
VDSHYQRHIDCVVIVKGLFLARECMRFVLAKYQFSRVMDIGSGEGLHAEAFRRHGKTVVTVDNSKHWGTPDIFGNFTAVGYQKDIDLFWCSHVLEHQRNPGDFLDVLCSVAKEDAIVAITVPPAKHNIVGGHVTLWNAGLLLYNMVLAGFDCREAHVKTHEYNISVVVKKKKIKELPELHMDSGDIEKLAPYFPLPVKQNFDGDIKEVNWK